MALQKTHLAQKVLQVKLFRAKKSGAAIAGTAGPPTTALFRKQECHMQYGR